MRFDWFVISFLVFVCCNPADHINHNWDHYLGDGGSSQYSPLDQINKSNVQDLKLAWEFNGGEQDADNRSQIQCNPLIIDGTLYGTNARLKLFALDAKTGEKRWMMNPFGEEFTNFGMGVNRGLAFHEDEKGQSLFYSVGSFLFAVNPVDGSLKENFGSQGKLDLHDGLDRDVSELFIVNNTPGVIYDDLIIIGSRVSESTGAAPGHIRAFDVHTGEQKWIFHTIPHPGEFGNSTWPDNAWLKSGGANVWAGFSIDSKRGIVFCPTGSASYDFYGGDRAGDNLFANCILALDARTGKRIWHFQTVHHDLWDKDLPAPPNLVKVKKNGKSIDALAQITKSGYLFVLDRESGKPVYPVEELEFESSTLPGESTSKTQPVPTHYPPFTKISLNESDLANRNEQASVFARGIWESTDHKSMFSPPSEKGVIVFPGFDGGGEWGGAAYDPSKRDLIVNSSVLPWRLIMDKVEPAAPGELTYKGLCQNCHGKDFSGNQMYGNIPSLKNLKERLGIEEARTIMRNGKGIMPGFQWLSEDRAQAIYDYINGDEDPNQKKEDLSWSYPYRMRGYERLYAPDGYPMINPPWGLLTSINLDRAVVNWQVPLGEHEELIKQGVAVTGTENYGGPVVTAGGLVFIASTPDEKIRAFDCETGEILWSYNLPAAGYATPATYRIDGKQYVVIACGGGKLKSKSGDSYLAFALE